MKNILMAVLVLIGLHATGQRDTLVAYYENGQLRTVSPKLDGKPHGTSKTWYENGQLWFVSDFENGKKTKTIMFYENGRKSYAVRQYKWRMKLRLWHPNGKRWTVSKAKYSRSIEKTYDSTGVLVRKIIEKKGSMLVCDVSPDDSLSYKDRNCTCSWGNVFWRNGVFVDEKGRDLSTHYSYCSVEYYPNGDRQRETTWNNLVRQPVVREWDENGHLIPAEEPAQ